METTSIQSYSIPILCERNAMGTYRQIYYQIVFGTKYRKPTINPQYDDDLYRYIWGIIENKKCKLYRINGIEDHIHIMSDLHPTICLADYVKDIKVASSIWMNETGKFPAFEGWQDGYGAFTYSIRERDMIINYIKKQKAHHKKEKFYDEYKRLLSENGIEFDEKYML
ncbi:MAG: IS200/IS605 family transposase [Ferruginibacter sp.]